MKTTLSAPGVQTSAPIKRPREDYVPESFEDLFDHYYKFVVSLVSTFGIDYHNAEDVSMTILMIFFEKDVLSDFNPEFVSEFGGVERTAVFRTFLSGFVRTYVRHYVDRQRVLRRREGFSTDTVVAGGGAEQEMTWLDVAGPLYEEEFDSLYEEELVKSIRDHLATVAPKNNQDLCNLPKLFEAVLAQTRADGKVNTEELAAHFGVTRQSINNWQKRLRTEVAKVIGDR